MYGNSDNDPKGEWRPSDLTLGFSYLERPNLYYPLRDPKTDIYYPPNPDRVWVYATETRQKPGQRVQAKTMEEFISIGQILFPQEQQVMVWNNREELLAAIEGGDVPKTGKNPMLRHDLPDLDFWIGKKVGFGRPAFKRYKADLRNLNQPLSSWVVPSAEQKRYEAENSFVSGTNQEGRRLFPPSSAPNPSTTPSHPHSSKSWCANPPAPATWSWTSSSAPAPQPRRCWS